MDNIVNVLVHEGNIFLIIGVSHTGGWIQGVTTQNLAF